MKKLVFAIVVFINIAVFTFAEIGIKRSFEHMPAVVVLEPYEVVEVVDLNEKVQAAITGYKSEYTIKLLEYNESKKQTRVTLEEQNTQVEKVVVLDDEGKEI